MRKTRHTQIADGNGDLLFRIKEMSAMDLESWLLRAGKLMEGEKGGKDPFLAAGILFEEGPLRLYIADAPTGGVLMEEMLACCSIVDEFKRETPLSRDNVDYFIEDLETLVSLRRKALILNLRFYPSGTREPLELPREWTFRKAMEANTFARPVNVPGITASVVGQGMASLQGMQENYSFPDALDMLEVLNVRNYNQWAAHEAAKRGR